MKKLLYIILLGILPLLANAQDGKLTKSSGRLSPGTGSPSATAIKSSNRGESRLPETVRIKQDTIKTGAAVADNVKVQQSIRLTGRKLIKKPETGKPGCAAETGTVAVTITVDSKGKVVKAEKAEGTEASECLIKESVAAALATTFEAKEGEALQTGTITYKYKAQGR